MRNNDEFHNLLELAKDDDNRVRKIIKSNLIDKGEDALEELHEMFYLAKNKTEAKYYYDIINCINCDILKSSLRQWKAKPNNSLLSLIKLLNDFPYNSESNENELAEFLDELKKKIWLEVNDNQTGFEQVDIIISVFFDIVKCKIHDYDSSLNSKYSIRDFIINKKFPYEIASLIISAVCQDLKIPLYPVIILNRVFLCYAFDFDKRPEHIDDVNDILFYLILSDDKFHPLLRPQIQDIFISLGVESKKAYFLPTSNVDIKRYLLSQAKKKDFSYQGISVKDVVKSID